MPVGFAMPCPCGARDPPAPSHGHARHFRVIRQVHWILRATMNVPILGPSDCYIWWADPRSRPVDELAAVLSDAEAERAAGLLRPEDRRRFVTAAWLLRTVVAAQLGTDPRAVAIHRRCPDCGGAHGRPRITGTARPLHVSVTHAGDRVAVAVCAAEVGVDVEQISEAEISRSSLAPGEWAALRALPPYRRRAGFAAMWVRKEAALKATGHGLRVPPERVLVTGPQQPPELLAWPLDVPPRAVTLHTLDPGEGYVGAVAVISEGRPVNVSEYDVTRLDPAYHTTVHRSRRGA